MRVENKERIKIKIKSIKHRCEILNFTIFNRDNITS